jgi:hypothetical protein
VDPLFDKPYIFNARGQSLATYTKQGTLLQLADICLKMLSPVGSTPPGLKGYLWAVRFEKSGLITKIMVPKKFHSVCIFLFVFVSAFV